MRGMDKEIEIAKNDQLKIIGVNIIGVPIPYFPQQAKNGN